MDESLFDAIFALCHAAEDAGYEAVADGLELCLDIYLKERRIIQGLDVMFVSGRARRAREVAEFQAALREEGAPAGKQADAHTYQATPQVGWTMASFPLAIMSHPVSSGA